MKALVTGGVGFIGTNLVKRLLDDGNKVVSLDNYTTGVKENEIQQKGVQYFDVDLRYVHDYDFFMDKPDVIFHTAALARIQPSLQDPTTTIQNNFDSTLNILEWARRKKCPVIFAGSSSFHQGLWGSPYAWSKFAGEQLCELYNKVYNLPTAICRFYNVYGPHQIEGGDYAAVIGIFERQYKNHEPLTITGDGEQRRDFTHVDDIVDGLIRCGEKINKVSGEEFELGSGVNFSINEVANMFGDDYSKEYIPARDGEYEMTLCTDDKANKLLGWNPKNNINDYIKGVVR
tara:strand:+ start:3172 stop:4035 length:864 start_codon:yes stop_codon:yes gene_type:complete